MSFELAVRLFRFVTLPPEPSLSPSSPNVTHHARMNTADEPSLSLCNNTLPSHQLCIHVPMFIVPSPTFYDMNWSSVDLFTHPHPPLEGEAAGPDLVEGN